MEDWVKEMIMKSKSQKELSYKEGGNRAVSKNKSKGDESGAVAEVNELMNASVKAIHT